mgnify:CR=1 FL=1
MTAEASSATARPAASPARPVPQSPAKVARGVPQSPAKPQAAGLAVLDDLIDDADAEGDFETFAGLDNEEWRIERRYRRRKGDGALIMYWNYRRRKVARNDAGQRRIEYRKGGSREI